MRRFLRALLSALLLTLFTGEALAVTWTADFDYLRSVNERVIAWLYRPDGAVSLPVMYTEDSAWWLTHNFTGRENLTDAVLFTDSDALSAGTLRLYLRYGRDTALRDALADTAQPLILVTETGAMALTADAAGEGALTVFRTDPEAPDAVYALSCEALSPDGDPVDVTKAVMDSLPTLTKTVTVPGRGDLIYYAQNDPLWADMVYEPVNGTRGRTFGANGCCPTAAAIALASLLSPEALCRLSEGSGLEYGFTFCEDSVNQWFCTHRHLQYRVSTAAEYLRYLPEA